MIPSRNQLISMFIVYFLKDIFKVITFAKISNNFTSERFPVVLLVIFLTAFIFFFIDASIFLNV